MSNSLEIFYIEDDAIIAQAVKEYFEQLNYKVTVFPMIEEAKKAIDEIRQSCKSNERFEEFEQQKDNGINLANLTDAEIDKAVKDAQAHAQEDKKKKEAIEKLAKEYKSIIPKEVYEAVMAYEFDIKNDKNYKVA